MSLDIVLPAPRLKSRKVTEGRKHDRKPLPKLPVIGLIDNVKTGADRMLDAVGRTMVRRGFAASYFVWQKPTTSHAISNEERAMLLARAHIIISGIGD